MKLKFTLILLLLVTVKSQFSVLAQDNTKLINKNLSSQYSELILKSKNNDQGFKIINPERLSTFQNNLADTIKSKNSKIFEIQGRINEQIKTIKLLKSELDSEKQNVSQSKSLINEISLLGISINKSTYTWIMWGLVMGLGAALIFVVFQSSSARKEAKYRTKLFHDLFEEFQTFKTKSNEKEKKLARELQTERNRVEELLKK
ncbi:MAG: hypothetical protein H7096_07735 [Flavobacterium sp.]|nr:hypothetical protein [Pedobacter sp.]